MIVLLILFALLLLACVKKKKADGILLLFFLWLLFAFQYGNADYASYENMYRHYALWDTGFTFSNIGYKVLCDIFFNLGFTYQQFLVIEATVGMAVIACVIFKNCKIPALVVVLYFIYPYMMDTVQVRNFLAEALILLGISLYINFYTFKGYAYMAICLVFASLIHVSALTYLILLLLPLLKREYLKILIVFAALFELSLIFYMKEIVNLLGLGDHISGFFDKSISAFTAVFLVAYFLIAYIVFRKLRKEDNLDEKDARWNIIVTRVNVLLIPFLPLCFVTNDFQRLYRNVFILSYIAIVNLYAARRKYKVKLPLMKVETMILLGTFGYAIVSNIVFVTSLYWDTVVLPLFENNILFG